MDCPGCGTALAASAKFCHKCGARAGAPPAPSQAAGWRVGLPWGVAGAALGALVTVLAMRGGEGKGAGSGADLDAAAARSPLPAPDISRMSPEERARRLFDRVMGLAQAGKQDSVQFFIPMALGAYLQLPARDVDAHYDMGLLYLAAGDAPGALAQADSILRRVPTHLYGFVLRGRAYEMQTNRQGARRAYADFLKNEIAERARQRPEYAEHSRTLDAFHDAATQVTGRSR